VDLGVKEWTMSFMNACGRAESGLGDLENPCNCSTGDTSSRVVSSGLNAGQEVSVEFAVHIDTWTGNLQRRELYRV